MVRVFLILVAFAPIRLLGAENDGYLAFGDLRGYLEPCGCDPSTDLGGIQRLGVFLERERRQDPQVLVLDLGNNLSTEKDSGNTKNRFLQESLKALRPSASLVNRIEWDLAKNKKITLDHVPFVLSNMKTPMPHVATHISLGNTAVVLGYFFDNSTKEALIAAGPELFDTWKKLTHKAARKILLFSGSDDDLKKIANAQIFDVIVSSHKSALSETPDSTVRDSEGLLLHSSFGALDVYMVPVGGQGVLRGGKMRETNAPSLESMLSARTTAPTPRSKEQLFSWLDKSYDGTSAQTKIYKAFNSARQKEFQAEAARKAKVLKSTPFAGAASCTKCHEAATKVWNSSTHAQALVTLQKRHKDQDADCVQCHVLGFHDPGGFISADRTPQFSHVQCENCHGPAKQHVANPKILPARKARETCVGCHHNPHSPTFAFDKYWPKIAH